MSCSELFLQFVFDEKRCIVNVTNRVFCISYVFESLWKLFSLFANFFSSKYYIPIFKKTGIIEKAA